MKNKMKKCLNLKLNFVRENTTKYKNLNLNIKISSFGIVLVQSWLPSFIQVPLDPQAYHPEFFFLIERQNIPTTYNYYYRSL